MDGDIVLVLCLAGLIGLGIPAMLVAGLRRRSQIGQIELLRRATSSARQPWQKEDSQLAELSKRVESLRTKTDLPAK